MQILSQPFHNGRFFTLQSFHMFGLGMTQFCGPLGGNGVGMQVSDLTEVVENINDRLLSGYLNAQVVPRAANELRFPHDLIKAAIRGSPPVNMMLIKV